MTGMYIRVSRDSQWQNIEIEYLTPYEITEAFLRRKAN